MLIPFNIDVAHLLPADADVIQDDITGVPNDATEEKPEQEDTWSPAIDRLTSVLNIVCQSWGSYSQYYYITLHIT